MVRCYELTEMTQEELRNEVFQLRSENRALCDSVGGYKEKLRECLHWKRRLTERVSHLEEVLEDNELEFASFRDEVASANQNSSDIQCRYQAQIDDLNSALEEYQEKLRLRDEMWVAARDEAKRCQEELGNIRLEMATLVKQSSLLSKQRGELKTRLDQIMNKDQEDVRRETSELLKVVEKLNVNNIIEAQRIHDLTLNGNRLIEENRILRRELLRKFEPLVDDDESLRSTHLYKEEELMGKSEETLICLFLKEQSCGLLSRKYISQLVQSAIERCPEILQVAGVC